MNVQEMIDALIEMRDHWIVMTLSQTCDEKEGKRKIEALNEAIRRLKEKK